ncbi:MAG TPA: ATP-binding protein [Thermoanaerobaculia bacterium]|nr:ATP-binding protein [Thermoanaerobaculia bacterium]
MRRPGFRTLLVGLNAGLVLLAILALVLTGSELLERLADEQALARVDLAGVAARQAVERSAGDVRTSARLLAERPTVDRLLRERDAAQLAAFLERFRRTSGLSGCALLIDGRPLVAAGPPLPWEALAGSRGQPVTVGGGLALAAASPLPALPGAVAVTAAALDEAFVRRAAGQVGLPVDVIAAPEALARTDDPRWVLRSDAVETGRPARGRLEEAGLYLAVRPVQVAGEVVALVEASLSTAGVQASVAALERQLLLLSAVVAGVAILSGLVLGRRLARPVRSLTVAASRIGGGDLSTPVPRAAGPELGTLATTMEEMRRHLLRLTSELRRQQAEGEAILTGIVEGVLSVDRDRRIRYLNPQAAAILKIDPQETLGRFCGDVLNPAGPGGVRPCHEHCPILHARFRGGTSSVEHLQLADGTRRSVVITSAPPTEDRQVLVLRDETDLEAARRLRDAVLANISHEFKTPLSAQLASIELLRERLEETEDKESGALVQSLERGSLRLTQLIDNLLESVRIEAGEASVRRRPVALDEVVEEAVTLTAPLLAQRGQTPEVDLPYPLPEVRGDAPRLIQVFVNLLANANKYAPEGSVIRVGGAVEQGAVALWVEDEGPGLPKGEEGGRSLFARFVRSAGDDEPEQSGMGLGLWIVQSIVERHGGTVDAEPRPVGTRMVVRLPRQISKEVA